MSTLSHLRRVATPIDNSGKLIEIKQPIDLSTEERNKLYIYLNQLEYNSESKVVIYKHLEQQITELKEQTDEILKSMN